MEWMEARETQGAMGLRKRGRCRASRPGVRGTGLASWRLSARLTIAPIRPRFLWSGVPPTLQRPSGPTPDVLEYLSLPVERRPHAGVR